MNSLDYLNYIRKLPCSVCGQQAEPHHLEAIGMGMNRKKPTPRHYSAIPLCREHHTEIHWNRQKFEEKYRFNSWKEAFKLVRDEICR